MNIQIQMSSTKNFIKISKKTASLSFVFLRVSPEEIEQNINFNDLLYPDKYRWYD